MSWDFISVRRDEGVSIKSYKTASRAKSTIVTVEIEVSADADSYALGHLLSQLHEIKNPPKPKSEKTMEKERLALPAPSLRLTDGRESRK